MATDLGARLLHAGLVTRGQLAEALRRAPANEGALVVALAEGGLAEDALAGFFVANGLGPLIVGEQLVPERAALASVPAEMAHALLALPLRRSPAGTVVAMAAPSDRHARGELERAVGGGVLAAVARPSDLYAALARAYPEVRRPPEMPELRESEPPVLELVNVRRRPPTDAGRYGPSTRGSGRVEARALLGPRLHSDDDDDDFVPLVRQKPVETPSSALPRKKVITRDFEKIPEAPFASPEPGSSSSEPSSSPNARTNPPRANPERTNPPRANPERTTEHTKLPSTSAPSTSAPSTSAPSTSTPSTSTPSTSTPSTSAQNRPGPSTNAPSRSAPSTNVPGRPASRTTASPGATATAPSATASAKASAAAPSVTAPSAPSTPSTPSAAAPNRLAPSRPAAVRPAPSDGLPRGPAASAHGAARDAHASKLPPAASAPPPNKLISARNATAPTGPSADEGAPPASRAPVPSAPAGAWQRGPARSSAPPSAARLPGSARLHAERERSPNSIIPPEHARWDASGQSTALPPTKVPREALGRHAVPKRAPRPAPLGAILSAIRAAKQRDSVVELACQGSLSVSRSTVLLALRSGVLKGHGGAGVGLSRDAIANLWIPTTSPSLFRDVVRRAAPYHGPHGSSAADGLFRAALGSRGGEVALSPVLVGGKLVGILAADELRFGAAGAERVDALARAVGEAFQRIIAEKKK